jgi:hypothetical protein
MPNELLYASEIMPIVKDLVEARTASELQKATDKLLGAYPEVVQEYLEWDNPHKAPGPEEPHDKKSPFFDYKTGKKPAPQSDPKDYQPTITAEPYLKRAALLAKAFAEKPKPTLKVADWHGLQALHVLAKAARSELAKQPLAPGAAPPAPTQESRLCPRCGGTPCSCPGASKSAETKEALVEDREDFVPISPPNRPPPKKS